jgi:adenylate cyclase class 2
MSFEVEVKYRVPDHDRVFRSLSLMGCVSSGTVTQQDTYLNHPARDFAQTNEAFRIRRIEEENRVTYKGPRLPGPTKTREEIEVVLGAGQEQFESLLRVFESLGFRQVATIRKRRESFRVAFQDYQIEVALDTADGLGAFAEIEAIARDDADIPSAQQAVLNLAETLGLADVEPRSYLRMALEERSAATTGSLGE